MNGDLSFTWSIFYFELWLFWIVQCISDGKYQGAESQCKLVLFYRRNCMIFQSEILLDHLF